MELRVLRYFVTLAGEGNITKAARVLHITQPSLSRQLIQLENELDTKLFIRGNTSIVLTNEGILLLQRAKEILNLSDRTIRDFLAQKGQFCGEVSIGSVETMGTSVLPSFLKHFSAKYPRVKYNIYSGYAEDVKEKIDQGILDLGFLTEPIDKKKYDTISLPHKEHWGVIVRKDDALLQKRTISFQDIIHLPLLVPERQVLQRDILSRLGCNLSYEELNIFATYNRLSNGILLVEHGLGYAVCLQVGWFNRPDTGVCFLPFHPECVMKGMLAWKKNHVLSAAATKFIQLAKKQFQE